MAYAAAKLQVVYNGFIYFAHVINRILADSRDIMTTTEEEDCSLHFSEEDDARVRSFAPQI